MLPIVDLVSIALQKIRDLSEAFGILEKSIIMHAYLILELSIHDIGRFSEYIRKIPGFIKKHSGRYVVQGAEPTVMEGNWQPERVVVIEFPSSDHAKTFLNDPEAQALFKLRHETTTSNLILVEGCR